MGLDVLTGREARLCWGFLPAATVHDWTLTRTEDGWSLTGRITDAHTFRLSQQPLVFVIPTHAVRWPVGTLQMTDAMLTASLGPKESRDAVLVCST